MAFASPLHPWAQEYLSRLLPTSATLHGAAPQTQPSSQSVLTDVSDESWTASRTRLLRALELAPADVPVFGCDADGKMHNHTSSSLAATAVHGGVPARGSIHESVSTASAPTEACGTAGDACPVNKTFHLKNLSANRQVPCTSPAATAHWLQQSLLRAKSYARESSSPQAGAALSVGPALLSAASMADKLIRHTLDASLSAADAWQPKDYKDSSVAQLPRDTLSYSAAYFVEVLNDAVFQRSLRSTLWKRAADAHESLLKSASASLPCFLGDSAIHDCSVRQLIEGLFALTATDFYQLHGRSAGESPPLVLTPVDHGGFFRLVAAAAASAPWQPPLAAWLARPRTDRLLDPHPSLASLSPADRVWRDLCDMAQLRLFIASLLHIEVVARQAVVAKQRVPPDVLDAASGRLASLITTDVLQSSVARRPFELACTSTLLGAVGVLQTPTETLLTRRRHVPRFLKKCRWDDALRGTDAATRAGAHFPTDGSFLDVQSFYATFREALKAALPTLAATAAHSKGGATAAVLDHGSSSPCRSRPGRPETVTVRTTLEAAGVTLLCERPQPSIPWPVQLVVPSAGDAPVRWELAPAVRLGKNATGAHAPSPPHVAQLERMLHRYPTVVGVNELHVDKLTPTLRRSLTDVLHSRATRLVLRLR